MRLFIVSALLLVTTSAAAQSRWTVSVGPEFHNNWQVALPRVWGVRARAEYDLIRPNTVFGLRFETSGRWSPNQSYSYSNFDGSSSYSATQQMFDLMVGFNASVSPLPRARFSPYVSAGVYGIQQWLRWSRSEQTGSFGYVRPPRTDSRLVLAGSLGVGLRMRVGGRAFQLEYRNIYNQTSLTFGTRIPF